MFKKAKCRNISPKQRVCRFLITEQPCQTPLTDLVWGVTEGVQRIEEFSPFIRQSPLCTELGLMHVNPWFIKKWIELLLQSITVIKILATLLSYHHHPLHQNERYSLKTQRQIRIQNTPERPGCREKKRKSPGRPPFRALRQHFWEVLLRQLTSSFGLLLQMCGFPAQWAPAALALLQVPLCDSNKGPSWKPSAPAQL